MNPKVLIERLEDLRTELGDEAEVRLKTRQHWPFENAIHGVTSTAEMAASEEDEEDPTPANDVERVV